MTIGASIIPVTTTTASGFCTCEPIPSESAAGNSPTPATTQYNQLIDEGFERMRAVVRTGELQLRPVLMTCIVAGIGLLPAAWSDGIGSQVQKPLAIVVVTGMMLAPIVILVTLPVLISVFSRRVR